MLTANSLRRPRFWAAVFLVGFLTFFLAKQAHRYYQARQQTVAIWQIERSGHSVLYRPPTIKWQEGYVVTLTAQISPERLRALRDSLSVLPRLTIVFPRRDAPDAMLLQLSGLNNLVALGLSGTHVTDAAISHLQRLPTIECLYLDDTDVTDASIEGLERLSNLKELDLTATSVSDEGVLRLKKALPHCTIVFHAKVSQKGSVLPEENGGITDFQAVLEAGRRREG